MDTAINRFTNDVNVCSAEICPNAMFILQNEYLNNFLLYYHIKITNVNGYSKEYKIKAVKNVALNNSLPNYNYGRNWYSYIQEIDSDGNIFYTVLDPKLNRFFYKYNHKSLENVRSSSWNPNEYVIKYDKYLSQNYKELIQKYINTLNDWEKTATRRTRTEYSLDNLSDLLFSYDNKNVIYVKSRYDNISNYIQIAFKDKVTLSTVNVKETEN